MIYLLIIEEKYLLTSRLQILFLQKAYYKGGVKDWRLLSTVVTNAK
jgi:hypothetical protein